MNKILIDVYVPAAYKSYNMYVPKVLTVYQARLIIIKLLNSQSEDVFILNEQSRLYHRKSGTLIEDNILVGNSELVDGSHLMII